jgi:hypothetical protein
MGMLALAFQTSRGNGWMKAVMIVAMAAKYATIT